MINAIIFDFDGLIIETEFADFQSWQEIYQQYGATLPLETWLPLIGTGASSRTFHPHDHLETQLGRLLNREEIRRIRRQRYVELVEAQPLLPGVEALIAEGKQRKLQLAVASSSLREWVVGHLTKRRLDTHFECIICGDEVALTKPSPDVYQRALTRLGIQANQAIALEDSPNGIQAAKQASIYCIAIPNPLTRQFSLDEADLRLNSLAELPLDDLLKNL